MKIITVIDRFEILLQIYHLQVLSLNRQSIQQSRFNLRILIKTYISSNFNQQLFSCKLKSIALYHGIELVQQKVSAGKTP